VDLSTLLTHLAKDYLDDRTDLVDGDPDELYGDALLVRYLNAAQRILARRSWCIIETGVAPAGLITLRTGVSLYHTHKSVLRIYDATPTTQVNPLGRTGDIQLRNTSTGGFNPYDLFDAYEIGEWASLAGNTTNTAGPSVAIASDAGTRTVRVFPPPTVDQNGLQIALKVARLPITWLTLDDMEAEPEVPEDYHLLLTTYAAGKALTQPNVDGQMKADGRLLLAEFDAAVKEARQDRQRAEMAPDRWVFSSATAVTNRT